MWRSLRFLSGLGVLLVCAAEMRADRLRITSTPAGATVKIDGVKLGTTPLEKEYPGGYFHRTKTLVGTRLDHEVVAEVSLKDYVTQEIVLTGGPHNWLDLHGRNHGQYFVFKAREVHVDLVPESEATEDIATGASDSGRREGLGQRTLRALPLRNRCASIRTKRERTRVIFRFSFAPPHGTQGKGLALRPQLERQPQAQARAWNLQADLAR